MICFWWVINIANYPRKIQTASKISEYTTTVSEVVPNNHHSCVVSFSPGFKTFCTHQSLPPTMWQDKRRDDGARKSENSMRWSMWLLEDTLARLRSAPNALWPSVKRCQLPIIFSWIPQMISTSMALYKWMRQVQETGSSKEM